MNQMPQLLSVQSNTCNSISSLIRCLISDDKLQERERRETVYGHFISCCLGWSEKQKSIVKMVPSSCAWRRLHAELFMVLSLVIVWGSIFRLLSFNCLFLLAPFWWCSSVQIPFLRRFWWAMLFETHNFLLRLLRTRSDLLIFFTWW